MNKQQLLELEKNAHLSIAELRKAQPALAKPVDERLEERVKRTAVTSLAGGSEKLRKVAATIKLPLGATPDKTKLRESTLKALREAVARDRQLSADAELRKELDELEKAATQPAAPGAKADVTLAESLRFDEPIAFNPEFRRDLDAARLYRLGDAFGLGDNTAKVLIDHVGSVTEVTNDRLEALVRENKLDGNDAKAAGLASSLYQVLDERPELVAAAKTGITGVHELVKNDKAAWVKLISDSKTKSPGGISADEYAGLLVKKIARLFPTDALAHRLGQVKVADVLKEHAGLGELRRLNPNTSLIGIRDFVALKTDGIAPSEVQKLKARYESTVKLANRYPGLRLAAVLDDGALADADKDREVTRRTSLANAFFTENAEVLGADLTHGSDEVKALKFPAGTSDTDKTMVVANARTYQRAMSVTEDLEDAEALVVGGYRSALSVATSRVDTLAAKTGLKSEIAVRYQEKAKGIASGVTAHIGTVIDVVKGGFKDLAVGNISPALAGYLKEIPGFADFFGNQDYCNCKHCQSILSPAAYFVDMMCFVDEWITQPFFAAKSDHPLNLKTRRPDLWTLELTCENTSKPIPYLVIINEILENAVAKDAGFANNFGDRVAVGTKVYKDTLPDAVDSFRQPLNLPFEELSTYLRHFERTLADVADAGNASGDALARLRLSLPPKDHELITQVNDSLPFLRQVYGIQFNEAGGAIQKFDAQKLLKPMGVNRDELGELIASRIVTTDGAVNIRIKGEKRSAQSIQNDIENIEGLTRMALDRMHRFVRLWRATGWRIGELDLVLTHLKQPGVASDIDTAAVQAVAHIHRLQSKHDVSVEELIALLSSPPQHAILHSAPSVGATQDDGPAAYPQTPSPLARFTTPLFDRLFNQARFVETGGSYPQPGTTFLHPALASTPPANVDPNLHRLQAGTGTDDDELLQLIVGLARPLGIDLSSANDNKKQFALSGRNLSLLYRHARLARLLKVGIPELFALCGLAPEIRVAHVEGLSDLDALLKAHAWWKTTKWTLAELVQIVRPGLPPLLTSAGPVAGTAGGESVTYTPTVDGSALAAETVTFGVNADLPSAVADWNGKAQRTIAFRSDAFGVESSTGTHLSIRSKAGTGHESRLDITADTASIFSAALPQASIGSDIAPELVTQESASPDDLAKEIVEQVRQSNALAFADTVFALLRPLAPVATSGAPLAATAGGETVTYTSVLNGRSEAAETIVFATNPTLDAVVADWNAKATFTKAYRSDAAGKEIDTGTHLSITTKDGSGSTTRLTITADRGAIFTGGVPKEVKGSEITEAQSRALIAANSASLESIHSQDHYRLAIGVSRAAPLALPPLSPPVATSRVAVNGSTGGERVRLQTSINGAAPRQETLTLALNADIDAVITDWNGASALTLAYRSDATGAASRVGAHLSIRVNGVGGQNTTLTILEDSAGFFSGAAYRGQGVWVEPSLEPALREILFKYHARDSILARIPGVAGVQPESVQTLLSMLGVDLDADIYFRELRGDISPPQKIAGLIEPLQRLGALFAQEDVFDLANLEFIRTSAALFGITDFNHIATPSVRRIELFRKLLDPWLTRNEPCPDLRSVLLAFTATARFGNADQEDLAALLGCDVGVGQSMQAHLNLGTTPFEVLQELIAAVELSQVVGIGCSALKLAQSVNYDELTTASGALQTAFRARYEDEVEWEKKVDPFRDALLSRRRDALVAYLVHSGAPEFNEVSDLYHYYLLDVEVEGCMRTSRVAAAIDSIQLYVHRCLMNLEETPPGHVNPVHVLPESIPDDEWAWREHYRTFEANRKIFLYPENYIEPELRDDKTPLFKTLEEELLSKEITDEAILEAYGRYLRGFDELAHLTIAGSYHEKDDDAKRDALHLLGVTSDDPPVFYYRRVEDAHYGAVSDERATHWGAWEKLNIQVPVRKIAPLIHNGQLYVFWIRYVTKAQNKVTNGESKFTGYQHKAYVEFSRRKLDGSWTTPQKLRLDESPFGPSSYPPTYQDDGVVLDPIVPKGSQPIELPFGLDFTIYSNYQPLYDQRNHEAPREDYSLSGFQWNQLYPATGTEISLRGADFQMWSPVDLYRLRIGPRIEPIPAAQYGVPWLNPALLNTVEGEIYRVDANGNLNFLKKHTGWRKTWHSIIPGNWGGSGLTDLLFYDATSGEGEIYRVDANGNLTLLKKHTGWRKTWHSIILGKWKGGSPFGGSDSDITDLLFYDATSGEGEIYRVDANGNLNLLKKHTGWRKTWYSIIPGNWGGSGLTDLLFYDGLSLQFTLPVPPSRIVWSRKSGNRRDIHSTSPQTPCFDLYSYASLLIDEERFKRYEQPLAAVDPWKSPQWDHTVTNYLASVLKASKLADISGGTSLDVVNGSLGDVILQTSLDAFYLQAEVRGDGKYHLRRLNTSLSEDIADVLFNHGLGELLATKTQLYLKEHPTGLSIDSSKVEDATKTGDVDFNGPNGTYLREVFFHIPFLIANHLNSQGRFEDAQRWYHYIFDPTASETIQGLPAGLSDEERRRRELDRNWRYREFRGLTLDSLRAQLTNGAAIDRYKRDPFNPHAIARLRTSAYQKAIVMKYVDNLLDWGDDLFIKAFAQLNPEYLREATLRYVTAQDILGDRPALLGDCGEGKLTPKVFPKIKDALADDSEFLMEMESVIVTQYRLGSRVSVKDRLVVVNADRGALAINMSYSKAKAPLTTTSLAAKEAAGLMTTADTAVIRSGKGVKDNRVTVAGPYGGFVHPKIKEMREKGVSVRSPYDGFLKPRRELVPGWGWSFVREVSPIFCVPGNDRMLTYWDRVSDRLYKLRHCQDIEGVFRLLPLFAPEIEPGLLVGGKAAGLSLEDILAASAGSLPPYRFRYLVDKAKGFAATVQSFGAALFSALEKRDAEELAKLRNVHQKNLLTLTSEVKKNELKIAEEGIEILTRRQSSAQYRQEYYSGLITAGLLPSEHAQRAGRWTAVAMDAGVLALDISAAIAGILPRVGSPFAMVYGGEEVHRGLSTAAQAMAVISKIAEMTATLAGLEAGNQRREEGWNYQKKLAEHDLKTIEKEIAVSELRKAIATRSLELHDKAKEQHDEIMEFFADKFSNLGLYTHLSRTLQQLHREAYNNALAMARLAEQAYRFERPGDATIFVGGEWDASRSGLLAGERLLMALNKMDKRFIETNTRQAEINQSFSLAQIAPQAIIDLKETGRCEFAIPEFYFDMFYPGQYRRRVRAVRLTIPCITGPYTNISAKLTLLKSYVRKEAALGAANLFEIPTTGTSAISTSTGQGDAGVFELSFRDEKYMPFEGAGAVSEWRIELPSYFRPFDYHTINDVLLNLSYTAEEDGVMRQQVESRNAAVEGALLHYLSNNTLTRVFSLRQEFSNAYNRLVESAAGTAVTIKITNRHFPLFLQGWGLTVVKATMVLAVTDRNPVGAFAMTVNGTAVNGFPNPTNPVAFGDVLGGLPSKSLGGAFTAGLKRQHTVVINAAGNLAAPPGAGPLLAQDKIRDIMIVVEYRL